MYDKLVIVESPSKSKTIENYLGKEYHVTSCLLYTSDAADKICYF